MGVGYRRARLSALAGGAAFAAMLDFSTLFSLVVFRAGAAFAADAASSLASAARSGSRRGAWGYRSPSMTPRIADATAASSSSGEVNCRHRPDIIGADILFNKEKSTRDHCTAGKLLLRNIK
jgi:hypothetical protein